MPTTGGHRSEHVEGVIDSLLPRFRPIARANRYADLRVFEPAGAVGLSCHNRGSKVG